MLAAALLPLASVAAMAAHPRATAPLTSAYSLAGASDVVLSGGASLAAAPLPALRSGSPHQHSTAQFVTPFTPGVTITAVSLSYRYSRGYSGATCSKFTVQAAGSAVYSSPVLSDYPYSKSKPNYSPPVIVKQAGLSIAVPPAKGAAAHLELVFDNNDCK
jgi:hypothetical protein